MIYSDQGKLFAFSVFTFCSRKLKSFLVISAIDNSFFFLNILITYSNNKQTLFQLTIQKY